MSKIFTAALVLIFVNAGGAISQESPTDSLSTESVQLSKTLDNGMQVVVKSMPNAALVRVGIFYAAGSAVEPDSLRGLAHLSEHLLTESSLNHPDGELIRNLTLYSTYRNAHTGSAFMQFDTECLPVFLPDILELEADRFRGVTTDSISFEREKVVVIEELAMRKRLPPTQEFLESVFHACYSGHPFGRDVGGSAETVAEISVDDFLQFQENHIRPERSAIVVKGPLEPEKTLADIERIFGFGPPNVTVFQETPPYPPRDATQIITDSQDHTGLQLCLAFRVSLKDDLDAALIWVLPHIMEESGLHPHVRSVPGEAVVMLTSRYSYSRPSTNNEDHWGRIYYEFNPEQQSLRSMGYQWEGLSEMVHEMGDPEVFEERIQGAINELVSTRRNPGRSTGLGSALVNGNEYMTIDHIREILAKVGPEEFNLFMGKWIQPDLAVVGISHGRDSERPATIRMAKTDQAAGSMGAKSNLASLTRAEIEPVLKAYGEADLIKLSRFKLENGIPVFNLLIPESDHWAMAGYRTFKGIKDIRPGKKPGITRIFNQVVNYDPKQKRDPDRDMPPRKLPYDLKFHLGWNNSEFFAQGSVEKVDRIIKAVDNRVASRDFNSMRWYSVIRWGEEYLRETLNRKIFQARAWRMEQIFGSNHPSVGMWAPDPEKFKKLKYKDLANLHKDYFQKTRDLVLMVAGREGRDNVKPLLNRTFGQYDSWRPAEPVELPEEKIQDIHGKVIPDLTRGDVMLDISFPLVQPQSGPQATITALVLKSALNQILTDRLREQEGLTYSIGARVYSSTGYQMWEISVTCQPGQSPAVLSCTRHELARIMETGFDDDEIARARLDLSGWVISKFSDQESGLESLRHMAEFGDIPLNPLQEISMVKTEEVNALARSVIDPAVLVFTATGPLFEEDIDRFDHP